MKPEYLFLLGLSLIFFGMLLIILSSLLFAKESKVEIAIGGFIGPIPFGFATSKELLFFIIILSIVFLILFFVLYLKI